MFLAPPLCCTRRRVTGDMSFFSGVGGAFSESSSSPPSPVYRVSVTSLSASRVRHVRGVKNKEAKQTAESKKKRRGEERKGGRQRVINLSLRLEPVNIVPRGRVGGKPRLLWGRETLTNNGCNRTMDLKIAWCHISSQKVFLGGFVLFSDWRAWQTLQRNKWKYGAAEEWRTEWEARLWRLFQKFEFDSIWPQLARRFGWLDGECLQQKSIFETTLSMTFFLCI